MRWPLAILLLLSACTTAPSSEDVLAKVNGREILLQDYLNLLQSMKPKDVNLPEKDRLLIRNLVLQTLVRRAVITTAAENQNISVTDTELSRGIEKYKKDYPEQIFRESLLEGMVDESYWKEQVRENLLMEKLLQQKKAPTQTATLEEALAYYTANPHQYQKAAQATALQIVVSDEKTAQEVYGKLKQNSARKNFVELARAHSIGPEGQTDAKITIEQGTLPEALDRTLFDSPIGTLHAPIKTDYGFHILMVLDRKSSVNMDFPQVKDQITQQLAEEKRRAWLEHFEEDLIRAAQIEYNRELIGKL